MVCDDLQKKSRNLINTQASRAVGFVLPVILVLIAIMMVAVMAVVSVMDQQRAGVLLQKKIGLAQQEIDATAAIVKYLLATHPYNQAGLAVDTVPALPQYQDVPVTGNEIRMDGTWYVGVGKTRFRIQDQNGLIPLNNIEDKMLESYLKQHKISLTLRQQLIDSLWDYVDSDDKRRTHGAEKQDYEREQLPHPPNRGLQLPQELAKVKGWQASGLITPSFLNKLTVRKSGERVNLNTSPADVLSLHPDLSVSLSQKIVKGRPWSSIEAINEALDVSLAVGHGYIFWIYPGTALKVHIAHPDRPWGREYYLRLKNGQILFEYLYSSTRNISDIDKLSFKPWRVMYVLDYLLDKDEVLPSLQSTGLEIFSLESVQNQLAN